MTSSKTTKSEHRNAWYGCIRDLRDPRDHLYVPTVARIPAVVDLRAHCPPVMDQGALGACTSHGITGALRHALINAGQKDFPMSRLQLYYDERNMEGTVQSDAGASIRDGIKCAAKIGVAHEKLWPYSIGKFKTKPPASAYADAVKFRAISYERVAISTYAIKSALAAGYPVIVGFAVFESFESDAVASTGIVPMPKTGEAMLGGHCVYICGYNQHANHFTARNSWSATWGSKGDCFIPQAYLGSSKYGSDYWIIKTEGS
jgi:C1A family cysteine protease